MTSSDFLSPSKIVIDETKLKGISIPHFLMNCGFDIAIILISFIIWKYLWLSTNKLTIKVVRDDTDYSIGPQTNVFTLFHHVRDIVKQMIGLDDCYLITKCGFEYYTYLFFLRRLALLMAILIITDLCIWIPFMLFFHGSGSFSLITMPIGNNNDFRAFYTIWVAFIITYGMHDMKKYLTAQLKHRLYRQNPKATLNNLKAKTLHMQFFDGHFIDEGSIKAQMQQYLVEDMEQEDRILAIQAIPTYSSLLQEEYKIKITKIIEEYGVENLSWVWKFFKEETEESLREKHKELIESIRQKIEEIYKSRQIVSCLIIVSNIQTAEKLCRQFQIGKALCNICPEFGYASEDAMWKVADSKMIVRWAQQPKDLIWINMSARSSEIINFVLFNFLCFLLLIASFVIIFLSTNDAYIKMPKLIEPVILLLVNVTLRFLIGKMVQWENKTLRSQWEIKQYKMTIIYYIINVILGSVIRDTLNSASILSTGWGWIELFSLIYKSADGLFYYVFILNQTAVAFFSTLIKPGQLLLDCYEAGLWYEKTTQVKRKALYGKNDCFRLGYAYSVAYTVLAIVVIYSASCPLIHFCGLAYFLSRLYLDTYTLVVFHEDQVCSNLRLIQKVVQTIAILVACWVFMIATTMVFGKSYSNAIILYLFCGVIIYYSAAVLDWSSLKDSRTDEIVQNEDIRNVIEQWKKEYTHPFNAIQYEIEIDPYKGRKKKFYSSMKRQ